MRIFTDINISKERGYYQADRVLQALNFEKNEDVLLSTPQPP